MPTVNGVPLVSGTIRMPRVGAWHLDFEGDVSEEGAVDSFAPDTEGAIRVTLTHEGVAFAGTQVKGGQKRAVYQGRIVGGRGGLSKSLPSRSYTSVAGVTAQQVIGDILRECGEELSAQADAAVLAKRVSRWTRTQGVASHALLKIVEAVGATWRVLRDGTIWIGLASYPEADVEHMTIDEDWSDGSILVATADEGGPGPLLLEPGTTFHGQKLELVEHVIQSGRFRTVAKNKTLANALDRFLDGIRQEIDFSRPYPAKVDRMNEDGTVAVTADDPKLKGTGLDKVPIYTGYPGSVTVPSGARCLVHFEAGDPSRPFVALWRGAALTEAKIGSGAQLAARADRADARIAAVESKLNAHITTYNLHVHPVPGVTTGGGATTSSVTAAVDTTMTPGNSTGADKTKIE